MTRGMFFFNECEEQSHREYHVLESCYLCARPLMNDSDVFMYRNTPFCSEDCRDEQIEFDEAREETKRKQSLRRSDSDQACPSKDVRQGGIQVA
ncbi:hypothetical protein QQ045_010216 [Rhodiola kirilowii]